MHQWPPDLFDLVVDVIPRLSKSKQQMLAFFEGAGVDPRFLEDHYALLRRDRNSFSKFKVARAILKDVLDAGDSPPMLRTRREILWRICQFEDFSQCWDKDRAIAESLVLRIRKKVDHSDTFTRLKRELEEEKARHRREHDKRTAAKADQRAAVRAVYQDLMLLFPMTDAWKRGKALERVLNRLFAASGIQVFESFTLTGREREGIVEQIDGVVEVRGHLYLVEIKWHEGSLGAGDVSQHVPSNDRTRGCSRAHHLRERIRGTGDREMS